MNGYEFGTRIDLKTLNQDPFGFFLLVIDRDGHQTLSFDDCVQAKSSVRTVRTASKIKFLKCAEAVRKWAFVQELSSEVLSNKVKYISGSSQRSKACIAASSSSFLHFRMNLLK